MSTSGSFQRVDERSLMVFPPTMGLAAPALVSVMTTGLVGYSPSVR
jgi:hypothetical protein